jgi:hypothetical protein
LLQEAKELFNAGPAGQVTAFGLGPSATNEKILKNETAFAALKRRATPATFNLVVWWRSRLGANKLVLCGAVRTVEARCFEHGET